MSIQIYPAIIRIFEAPPKLTPICMSLTTFIADGLRGIQVSLDARDIAHQDGDDDPGQESQCGNRCDGPRQPEAIGDEAC